MTLRSRLAVTMAILAAAVTTLVAGAGYRVTSQRLDGEVRSSLASFVSRLADPDGRVASGSCGVARPGFRPPPKGDLKSGPPDRGEDPNIQGLLVQCLDRTGAVIRSASSKVPIDAIDIAIARTGVPRSRVRLSGDSDDRLRIVSLAVPSIGMVQVARSLAENDRVLHSLLVRYGLLAGFVTALAALAGWGLARRITQPIMGLTAAAESVAATGRLEFETDGFSEATGRAGRSSRDETGRLTAAFATMIEALRSSREQQARLVQDAGHELRTPLTSMRTNVATLRRHPELTQDRRAVIIDDLHVELRELTTMTNELVDLAGHSGAVEASVACDLSELARRSVERCRRRTSRAISVTSSPAPVVVPQGLVLRAIDNLLANAAKFTPDDSPIEVTVSTVDSHASLVVRDHGAGVAAADMARIFDRFYRADGARSLPGSGLGLAIVHDIAISQRGTVSATNSENGGAMFTLTLPLAPVSVVPSPVGGL